ncbi:CPBP family glutamic-type intramembrane protease [Acetobacter orleanensis]|uniref:CAAX amino protease n=1 Tax=Acetobacter orleanensis TaxID=104099 RepID=A0A4Y3TMG3_9PROT|nr:CPBP family glutamic-type intramembrane protease [Acetobacter orleanensis]KXV63924.1 hypothetical protein AD949_06360 [Acetobacter orleanensis]PCD79695.1 CPBP family intramembrane metalloprotease [Acetobacter orleanensis]GAN69257.1 hypothetical protein Abol_030_022 [Acetobacter orleanensis JCM 7639]GBR28201.1 hypothetical protein AA0473_1672 [Acetobacter orleanensis NRIC 0473]GEB82217.1 hypothetical protein AOR01nite_06940 [Acetobacter orleanensis]
MTPPDKTTTDITPTDIPGTIAQNQSRFTVNWFYCLRCLCAQASLSTLSMMIVFLSGAVSKTATPASIPAFALAAIVIAPVFETFIFFFLPYWFFGKFIKNQTWRWALSFITTAIFFTLDHHSRGHGITPQRNWSMALAVGLVGSVCFFACFYLTTKSRRGSPFWTTACCHALYNTGVFAIVILQIALTVQH